MVFSKSLLAMPLLASMASAWYHTITEVSVSYMTTTVVSTYCETVSGEPVTYTTTCTESIPYPVTTTKTQYISTTIEEDYYYTVTAPPKTFISTETCSETDYLTLTTTDVEETTCYETVVAPTTIVKSETSYVYETDVEKFTQTEVDTVTSCTTEFIQGPTHYVTTEVDHTKYIYKTFYITEVQHSTITQEQTEKFSYTATVTQEETEKFSYTETEKFSFTKSATVTESCSGTVSVFTTTLTTYDKFYIIGTSYFYDLVSESFYISGTSTQTFVSETTSVTYIPGTRPPQSTDYDHTPSTAYPRPTFPCATITITKTISYEPEIVTAVQIRRTEAYTFSTSAEGTTTTEAVEIPSTVYSSFTSSYLVVVPTVQPVTSVKPVTSVETVYPTTVMTSVYIPPTTIQTSTYTPPPPPPANTTTIAPPAATGNASRLQAVMTAVLGAFLAALILA